MSLPSSNRAQTAAGRQAAAQPAICRDAAAQVAGAADLLLRPDLVGGLRHRGDRARRGLGGVAYLRLSKPIAAVRRRAAGRRGRVVPADLLRLPERRRRVRRQPGQPRSDRGADRGGALLVDYVMTVAVSVVAGVVAITSAVPSLTSTRCACRSASWCSSRWSNLRGVKESGKAFAMPDIRLHRRGALAAR